MNTRLLKQRQRAQTPCLQGCWAIVHQERTETTCQQGWSLLGQRGRLARVSDRDIPVLTPPPFKGSKNSPVVSETHHHLAARRETLRLQGCWGGGKQPSSPLSRQALLHVCARQARPAKLEIVANAKHCWLFKLSSTMKHPVSMRGCAHGAFACLLQRHLQAPSQLSLQRPGEQQSAAAWDTNPRPLEPEKPPCRPGFYF